MFWVVCPSIRLTKWQTDQPAITQRNNWPTNFPSTRLSQEVSGHFSENAWEEWPAIWHADTSWLPSELIGFWLVSWYSPFWRHFWPSETDQIWGFWAFSWQPKRVNVRWHICGAGVGGGEFKIGFNTNNYKRSFMYGHAAATKQEQNPLHKELVQHPIFMSALKPRAPNLLLPSPTWLLCLPVIAPPCGAFDLGLAVSVPLPIVMGIFVLLWFQSRLT